MKQKLLLLLQLYTVSTFSNLILAQSPNDSLDSSVWDTRVVQQLDIGLLPVARVSLDSLKALRTRVPGTDSLLYANYLYQEARYFYLNGDAGQGLALVQQAVDLRKRSKRYDPGNYLAAREHTLTALLLSNAGQHELALEHHLQALEIRENIIQNGGDLSFKDLRAYSWAGIAQELGALGESDQSIRFILRALPELRDSAKSHPREMRGFEAALFANLANNYLNTREHARAEYYFKLALKQMNSTLESPEWRPSYYLAKTWVNRGSNFALQFLQDSADLCFKKAETILAGIPPVQQEKLALAVLYQTRGMLNVQLEAYTEGEAQLREALRLFEETVGPEHPYVSGAQYNLGINFFMQNQSDKALEYAQLAERSLGNHPVERSFLDYIKSKSLASQALVQKYRNGHEKDVGLLYQVIDNAKIIEQAFDARVSSLEGELRFFNMAAGLKQALAPALTAQFMLYSIDSQQVHLEEAFRLSEKTKALGWLEKFRFQHNIKISESLSSESRRLRRELANLKVRRFIALNQADSLANPEIGNIDRELFELGRRHENYLARLKKDNQGLSDALYNTGVASATAIRNKLAENELMLAYFIGDSSLFIFALSRDTLCVKMLPHTLPGPSVERLLDAINSRDRLANKQLGLLVQESKLLYSKIITPVKPLMKQGASLSIIPDDALCALPFDLLFENGRPQDFPHYDYLLHRHSIRYGYSATALFEMENKKHRDQPVKRFLGMAPVFYKSQSDGKLDSLPSNILEVRNVLKVMGSGDTLIGKNATKKAFLDQAAQYETILLSTHGSFNDFIVEHSFVAFSESSSGNQESRFLLLPEIEVMTLNCDLLALSVCETAQGRFRNGEGIISLSRMFAFAGAKSLLATLWKVEDGTARRITEGFFENLVTRVTKDKALQLAKINYLKQMQEQGNEMRMHPYYWSSFILVGDDICLPPPVGK